MDQTAHIPDRFKIEKISCSFHDHAHTINAKADWKPERRKSDATPNRPTCKQSKRQSALCPNSLIFPVFLPTEHNRRSKQAMKESKEHAIARTSQDPLEARQEVRGSCRSLDSGHEMSNRSGSDSQKSIRVRQSKWPKLQSVKYPRWSVKNREAILGAGDYCECFDRCFP